MFFILKDIKNMNNNVIPEKKAVLLWRNIEINSKNASKIQKKDYTCFFQNFIFFSILHKNRNLEKYRKQYEKKTGKSWEEATIQEIYKAELVWGF